MRFLIGLLCGATLIALVYLEWPGLAAWLPSPDARPAHAGRALEPSRHDPAGEAPRSAPTTGPAATPARDLHPPAPPEPDATSTAAPAQAAGTAVIWESFRSEVTARGFAAFMARETGLRFEVQPVGLGQYRVVYHYVSEEDRRAALDAVGSVASHGGSL